MKIKAKCRKDYLKIMKILNLGKCKNDRIIILLKTSERSKIRLMIILLNV